MAIQRIPAERNLKKAMPRDPPLPLPNKGTGRWDIVCCLSIGSVTARAILARVAYGIPTIAVERADCDGLRSLRLGGCDRTTRFNSMGLLSVQVPGLCVNRPFNRGGLSTPICYPSRGQGPFRGPAS